MIRFFYLCIFVGYLFSSEILFNSASFNSNETIIENPYLIAVMVEFQEDSTPLTSGNGLFLDSIDIDMIWNDSGNKRCDGFIVDSPLIMYHIFQVRLMLFQIISNLFPMIIFKSMGIL